MYSSLIETVYKVIFGLFLFLPDLTCTKFRLILYLPKHKEVDTLDTLWSLKKKMYHFDFTHWQFKFTESKNFPV